MPGLILPNGQQTETMQSLELPMRNPADPEAKFNFVLPQPTDPATLQLDTTAKTLIYLLNETINLRVVMSDVLAQLKHVSAQLDASLSEQKRSATEQKLNSALRIRSRP